MVAMISAARQFEQQMKMLQTAQEREQSATSCCRPADPRPPRPPPTREKHRPRGAFCLLGGLTTKGAA
jgi:hypothetical protein